MINRDKQNELITIVRDKLQAYDATYTVSDRIREATLDGRGGHDRKALMGDPVRYAEVLPSNPGTLELKSASSSGELLTHFYDVQVWHEYADDPDYNSSSQSTWDNIVQDLIDTINATKTRTVGSAQFRGFYVDQYNIPAIPIYLTKTLLTHFMNFRVKIIG